MIEKSLATLDCFPCMESYFVCSETASISQECRMKMFEVVVTADEQ